MKKFRPLGTLGLLLVFFLAAGACAHQHPRVHKGPTQAKVESANSYYYVVRSNLEAFEGKFGESLQDLLKALETYPKDSYLLYLAAERFAEANQWEEALKYGQASLKINPKWTMPKILLGRVFEALGDFPKSERAFKQVIREIPDQEDGYFRLAQVLVDQKKFQPAIAVLRRWLAKRPDAVIAWYYIATIQSTYMENSPAAAESYKKITTLDPENVRIRYQLAQLYLKKDKLKEALDQFLEIEARQPGDLGVKLHIASIYHDLGRKEEAIAKLKNILKINPDADRIHYFLGLIFEQAKQLDEALQQFAKVPPPSGLYKDAVLHQALIYRDMKKPGPATEVLEKGLRKLAGEPQIYQFLSLVLEESDQLEKALNILKRGAQKIPDDEQLYFNLGVLYDKLKKRDESIQAMRQVIRINPNNAQALNFVGYLYAEKGERLEEAFDLVRQALKLKPNDGYITDSLGWVYFQRGDLKKALFYIQKANQLTPTEPTIVEHLGDIYLKQGRTKEALQQFRKALEYNRKKEKPNPEEIQRVEKKISGLAV